MTQDVQLAVIGGSGLYQMADFTDIERVHVATPFGPTSDDIVIGSLRGQRVAFLARHGQGHVYAPSQVPYRANIWALKSLGVRFIIASNACGSLREDYAPGHIVVPDQIFDYNLKRDERTFFETGVVAHLSVADPFCHQLASQLVASVKAVGGTVHSEGTFLIEDGPRFATRAESHIFRQWGCDIIGMTAAPEAFLAREAEIGYASMAHITDYDSWHETHEPVTVDMVVQTFQHNIEVIQQAIAHAIEHLDANATYACHTALDSAIVTHREAMPADALERLKPILQRVLKLA